MFKFSSEVFVDVQKYKLDISMFVFLSQTLFCFIISSVIQATAN